MLSFRDTDGQMLSAPVARAIALIRAENAGMDRAEMVGIIRRMDREEDAREMFTDIAGIEVFKR